MNIGLYQGAASLTALERWQENIAHNIACASTPGFKKSEGTFEAVMGGAMKGGDGPASANGTMPNTVMRINMQPGEIRSTGSELDFAIEGAGFFQIQRPNGETAYTRDGEFHMSAERTLVTKDGYPVLGDSGAITFRPDGGRISINQDGVIVQGETPIGRIGVVEFADPSALQRAGGGLFVPKGNAQPTPVERPAVRNGVVEESNVSAMHEMVNLVQISRAYEASQRLILAHDQATDKAIQTLGNPNS